MNGGTYITWIRSVHHTILYVKVNISSMLVKLTVFSIWLGKDVHTVCMHVCGVSVNVKIDIH